MRTATDLHHALIRRDKRFKALDVEENYMLVCHYCHMMGYVDARSVIDWFWTVQCNRYGEAHMRAWLDSLPLKIKPRFSNVKKNTPHPSISNARKA
jgi:hypothetical protein